MIVSYEELSGRALFFRLLEEEMRLVLDETGMLRRDWAEEIPCYVCGQREEQELFRKQGLRFVRCLNCGLVFMNPRLNAQALERLYELESAANDAWVDVLLSDAEETFQTADFTGLLTLLEEHGASGRLLDVGCSIGRLLNIARSRGYEVSGLELGARACDVARSRYGLQPQSATLENAGLPADHFDVLTAIEVLEHATDPRALLTEAHRVLRPGGLLLVGVPNVWSLGTMILGPDARMFNRNHLTYFNERTLARLLQDLNFEVLNTSTTVSVLDSVLNRLQMVDPFGTPETAYLPPALRSRVEGPARQETEQLLFDLGLGYRLRVLARAVED